MQKGSICTIPCGWSETSIDSTDERGPRRTGLKRDRALWFIRETLQAMWRRTQETGSGARPVVPASRPYQCRAERTIVRGGRGQWEASAATVWGLLDVDSRATSLVLNGEWKLWQHKHMPLEVVAQNC